MIFASPIFLFAYLPAAMLLYALSPRRFKNLTLLAVSLLFYAWGEPVYVLLMLFSIAANFALARAVEASEPRRKKRLFVFACALNLGLLGAFKYLDFAIGALNGAFRLNLPYAHLALPVGISFYTFQILSYVIDVYRGSVCAQQSIVRFGAYVSMFPQLVAGPIVRYTDVERALIGRTVSLRAFSEGIRRFCFGLGKKVLIANVLSETADALFQLDPQTLGAPCAWLAAILYAFQIYYDFSGYSDMAIGLGRMMGFDFPENFRSPYVARSVQDFWRRWHISLSSWFRDYLYIPLGGNRRGAGRTCLNLLIVFALCGLWHGANWTFVAWGLYHGAFLALERLKPVQRALKFLPGWITLPYTLLVVLVGWVLFRADSIAQALGYLQTMFAGAPSFEMLTAFITHRMLLALMAAALFSAPIGAALSRRIRAIQSDAGGAICDLIASTLALAALCLSMLALAGGTYNPFIYFRF